MSTLKGRYLSTRRKAPPKKLKANERRQDMQILVSASQGDIYLWGISICLMFATLVLIFTLGLIYG